MEQKKELIALIESIDNDKAINYLLDFVKMFCEPLCTLEMEGGQDRGYLWNWN